MKRVKADKKTARFDSRAQPGTRKRPKLRRSTRQQHRQAAQVINLVSHPVLADALSMLRKVKTKNERFRQYADLVAQFLLMEATKDLPTASRRIKTPLARTTQQVLRSDVVHFVSILRAGLALWHRQYLPRSRVGTIGVVREEGEDVDLEAKLPKCHVYQEKLPPEIAKVKQVIVLDPMLASGVTAVAAIQRLVDRGVKPNNITFVCVIAAVAGVLKLHKHFNEVKIIGAAMDKHLTKNWYIYPGLGDFGCRFFGTDDWFHEMILRQAETGPKKKKKVTKVGKRMPGCSRVKKKKRKRT